MKKGPSRRQWFLGLVGTVFGAGAAQTLERWRPGAAGEKNEPACLSMTRQDGNGLTLSYLTVTQGKVVIEYDTQQGKIQFTVLDDEGRVVEQGEEALCSISLSLPSRYPVQTYTYDAGKALTSYPETLGTQTTVVYDSGRRADTV